MADGFYLAVHGSISAESTATMRAMSLAYERLVQFLDEEMRMSHIYQPVMLEVLLTHGGRASAHDIAAAILAHDESQIDYYSEIVKRMPGRCCDPAGIVSATGETTPR